MQIARTATSAREFPIREIQKRQERDADFYEPGSEK